MDNTRKFPLILSSFWLKIIALLTMTIDHVGLAFDIDDGVNANHEVGQDELLDRDFVSTMLDIWHK